MLLVSAIHFKCSMVTGYNPKATVAIPSSTCFFNSLLPFTPGINPMRLSVFKSLIFKIGERMLLEWERDTRMIAQGQTEPMGRYTIGVHSSVAQYTLSGFLPSLLEKYPELEFELIHDLSRKITEQVISRECDIGLVINTIPHPDLVIHKLLIDEVTLFKHPAYKGDVFILDPALKQSQSILKNIRKVFEYKREIHSSSLGVIRDLCENKAGMAILPSRVAAISDKIKAIPNAPIIKD